MSDRADFEEEMARLRRQIDRLQRHLEATIFVPALATEAVSDARTVAHRLVDHWADAEHDRAVWVELLDTLERLCTIVEERVEQCGGDVTWIDRGPITE